MELNSKIQTAKIGDKTKNRRRLPLPFEVKGFSLHSFASEDWT